MTSPDAAPVITKATAGFGLLVLTFLGFISLGLPDGANGVAWPTMHTAIGAPLAAAGTLVLVMTLLSAMSGFLSGAIIKRLGTGRVVMISAGLTGGALVGFAQAGSLAWLLLLAAPLGLGAGCVDAALNGHVARNHSGRTMSWLHACWGIGATVGPLVMTTAIETGSGWRGGYLTLGLAQLGLSVLFLMSLRRWRTVEVRHQSVEAGSAAPEALAGQPVNQHQHGAGSAAGWLSAGIFATYVAVETTIGLWAGTVLMVGRGVGGEAAGIAVAAYYGGITGGRILGGLLVARIGNRRLVRAGLWLALAGAVGFGFAGSGVSAALALGCVGLGFAPVYPGLMHETPRRFTAEAAAVVIGRQSGASYLGAALLPMTAGALVGWWGTATVPLLAVGVIVALIAQVRILDRLTPSTSGD